MNEYESVIDQIQAVLAWDHDPDPEYMQELAEEYTRLVRQVNDRLRACDKLLSRGLRTEAIQQAETEPNLLDVTAILDFPEAEYWADYVSQYELPPLPELLVSIAADLNDAYAAEQPVARLLKLHRLHALALSPLRDRILILRELAERDVENAHWLEDLEQYEQARQVQIEEELETALLDKDMKSVAALDEELSESSWRVRPPRSLRARARAALKRLQSLDARRQARQVAAELLTAWKEGDEQRTLECAERWEELAATADFPEDDPLLEQVVPALSWAAARSTEAAGQKAWFDAVAALKKALDRDAPIHKLQRLVQTLEDISGDIPDDLQAAVKERFDQHDRQLARRRLLVISAVAAGVLFFLIIMGLLAAAVLAPGKKTDSSEDASAWRQEESAATLCRQTVPAPAAACTMPHAPTAAVSFQTGEAAARRPTRTPGGEC